MTLTPFSKRCDRSAPLPPTPPAFRRDGATEALLQLPRRHEATGCTCAPPPRDLYRRLDSFCAVPASSALPLFILSASQPFSWTRLHGKGKVHPMQPPHQARCLSDSLCLSASEHPDSRFRIHYRRGGRMRLVDGRLTGD